MGSAQVAQLVEHVTENHGVGGSIPPLGTIVGECRERQRTGPDPTRKTKALAMSRIGWANVVLAGIVAGLCVSFAAPGFAQTNEACVLRCLDHGHLDQYCQRICTNGVPPPAALAPNRAPAPAQQPAAQSPPPPSQSVPPSATQSSPVAPQPASAPLPPSPPVVEPAPQPAQNVTPIQPVQEQAPPQPAAQSAPQQVAKPPPPPVNERCVLLCLDHGHLDQYCQKVCTVH